LKKKPLSEEEKQIRDRNQRAIGFDANNPDTWQPMPPVKAEKFKNKSIE
jgi:hypothetical protein